MKHVVLFSGGIASWATAKLVAERHGTDSLVLLFADTLMEDEDLYRFVTESAANVGGELVRLCDGRTPWQVFKKERLLGNSYADPCSKLLKRKVLTKWQEENCDPNDTVIYLGYDWTEANRLERARPRFLPWRVESPLCDPPYLLRDDMRRWCESEGIRVPRLYDLGFAHNNCGGFCVKAGQGHFAHLLEVLPERYAEHEEREQEFRSWLGKDVSILQDRRGGTKKPLTLRELRQRLQGGGDCDRADIGGCACMEDPDTDA